MLTVFPHKGSSRPHHGQPGIGDISWGRSPSWSAHQLWLPDNAAGTRGLSTVGAAGRCGSSCINSSHPPEKQPDWEVRHSQASTGVSAAVQSSEQHGASGQLS